MTMPIFASAPLVARPQSINVRAGWGVGSICGLATGLALVAAEGLGCGAVCPGSAATMIAGGVVAGGITFGPVAVLERS